MENLRLQYNEIGTLLDSDAELQPRYRRKANGEVDARDWCEGFMAAVNQSREAWEDVLDPISHLNGLMLPLRSTAWTPRGGRSWGHHAKDLRRKRS